MQCAIGKRKEEAMPQTQVEIEALLRTKADEDDTFRAQLLSDPRSAITAATGLAVPEDLAVHVHEESATDFHLVLPPAGGRLSDEEMNMAGAGCCWNGWW